MINPYKMKKDDLLTFFVKTCRHGHRYNQHPSCYLKETKQKPKIGYLDIETSGLNANFAIMLSYAIKDNDSDTVYSRHITKKELHSKDFDKKIMIDCVEDMMKFDKLVTYYGTYFDIPFLRSRALYHKINNFPFYGAVQHTDVYFIAKSKLKLSRKSLAHVCGLLGIKGKNHVLGDEWLKASIQGDTKALGYILDHNIRDVKILQKAYRRLKDYARETKRSV